MPPVRETQIQLAILQHGLEDALTHQLAESVSKLLQQQIAVIEMLVDAAHSQRSLTVDLLGLKRTKDVIAKQAKGKRFHEWQDRRDERPAPSAGG